MVSVVALSLNIKKKIKLCTGFKRNLVQNLSFFQFRKELLDAFKCFDKMVNGIGIGNTNISFSAFAEGISGNNGDLFAAQKPFAKFLGGKPGGAYAWKDIKCALRGKAVQPHFIK